MAKKKAKVTRPAKAPPAKRAPAKSAKRRQSKKAKAAHFSATKQPKGRGRKKATVSALERGTWSARVAARLASKGVEGSDIIELLGVTKRMSDPKFRETLESIVKLGHASYRSRLQDIASRNAESKPSVLSKELGAWAPKHRDEYMNMTIGPAVDKLVALIDKALAHQATRGLDDDDDKEET